MSGNLERERVLLYIISLAATNLGSERRRAPAHHHYYDEWPRHSRTNKAKYNENDMLKMKWNRVSLDGFSFLRFSSHITAHSKMTTKIMRGL